MTMYFLNSIYLMYQISIVWILDTIAMSWALSRMNGVNLMARLRPSSAPIWVECPGSVKASEINPLTNLNTEGSDGYGTAAHWVFEKILGNNSYNYKNLLGKKAPNGVAIDDGMIDEVRFCVDNILSIFDPTALTLETKIKIPSVHDENEGTPDAWGRTENKLYVFDSKFGYKQRYAKRDWQLVDYSIGIMDLLEWPDVNIHMVVLQPRPFRRVSEWVITTDELKQYRAKVRLAAENALSDYPTMRTGEHCRYCKGMLNCDVFKDNIQSIIDIAGDFKISNLKDSQMGAQLALVKKCIEYLGFYETSLETQITHKLLSGVPIHGWGFEKSLGALEWVPEAEEVAKIGDLYGVNLRRDLQVKTPAQSKKLLDKSIVDMYSKRKNGKTKLIQMDTNEAKEVFKK